MGCATTLIRARVVARVLAHWIAKLEAGDQVNALAVDRLWRALFHGRDEQSARQRALAVIVRMGRKRGPGIDDDVLLNVLRETVAPALDEISDAAILAAIGALRAEDGLKALLKAARMPANKKMIEYLLYPPKRKRSRT